MGGNRVARGWRRFLGDFFRAARAAEPATRRIGAGEVPTDSGNGAGRDWLLNDSASADCPASSLPRRIATWWTSALRRGPVRLLGATSWARNNPSACLTVGRFPFDADSQPG